MLDKADIKPGIYHDIPDYEYHASPGVSNSMLGDMEPPRRCYDLHINPHRPERKARAGQLEGTLAHCLTLEPDTFGDRFVIGETINRNTKKWKDFVAENPDKIAIQQSQYDTAKAQADAVSRISDVANAMSSGHGESSVYWSDEVTGELCRCRPDWYSVLDSGVIIIDLKTYSSADPDEFTRQAARKDYERQAAFYSDGMNCADGYNILAFIFVAVTTEYPFIASATMLDEDSIQVGRDDYRERLDLYHQCKESGHWPGYDDCIHIKRLPAWKFNFV